ncbi:hypothetical protein D3C72_1792460 [compost metagenome]
MTQNLNHFNGRKHLDMPTELCGHFIGMFECTQGRRGIRGRSSEVQSNTADAGAGQGFQLGQ